MATLAPMSPPTRQPFGAINSARLRNLGNMKNKQNALPYPKPSNLKTFFPQSQTFDDYDSENLDPSFFASSNKSSIYSSNDLKSTSSNMNCFKPAQFALTRASATRAPLAAARLATPVATGKKRKADAAPEPAPAETERPIKSPRRSPPAPAGRSPKSKRVGILSRYRTSNSPFTRVDPPTFGTNKKGHTIPFSIDAAIAGTINPSKSHKPAKVKEYAADTVLGSMPKGWMFDIHTDSKDEEASNLMEHSACTLDISDDETSVQKVFDEENKENIPPHPGMNAPVMSAILTDYLSKKGMMTDDFRKPLGDLDATEFYAPGCDANTFFVVPEDEDVKSNIQNEVITEATTEYTSAKLKVEAVDGDFSWNDLVEMSKTTNKTSGLTPMMSVMRTGSAAALAPVLEEGPLLAAPVNAPADVKDEATIKVEDEDVAAGSVL